MKGITVTELKQEVSKDRWEFDKGSADKRTKHVYVRDSTGKEVAVTSIADDRDRLVLVTGEE